MLKVLIDPDQAKPENIERRSGKSKTSGNPWTMRSQYIWVYEKGAKFPLKIQFVLSDDVDFYPAGDYSLDLNTAFTQGNFNSINMDTRKLRLVPLQTK